MRTRAQMTPFELDAEDLRTEAGLLLDECKDIPPLEVARGLIDFPGEYDEGMARRLAAIIRDRVRGSGVMKTRLDPLPVKKAAAAPMKPARQPVDAAADDLFSTL